MLDSEFIFKQVKKRDKLIFEMLETLDAWAAELNSYTGYDFANQSTKYRKIVNNYRNKIQALKRFDVKNHEKTNDTSLV